MPQINDHYIYFKRFGPKRKTAIILLHHGLGSTVSWNAQITPLVDAGLSVIAYDRWGYGRSDMRNQLSIPSFTDDVDDLVSLILLEEIKDVILVGHSDGGTISLYFAAQYPELVRGLVIVAAHIYIEEKMIQGINNLYMSYLTDVRFQEGLSRIHGDNAGAVFDNWYNGWNVDQVINWDMRDDLDGIQCPVLVVQGEDDEHATAKHAIDLANCLQEAELWLIPGVGHLLPQRIPEQFNVKLIDFIERITGSQKQQIVSDNREIYD